MSTFLSLLAKIFGIANGASAVNKVGGILTNASLIPFGMWLLANADKRISFDTSYAFLALAIGVLYVILEVLRRSNTGHKDEQ